MISNHLHRLERIQQLKGLQTCQGCECAIYKSWLVCHVCRGTLIQSRLPQHLFVHTQNL